MATTDLTGAACAGTDPELFFPDESHEPAAARALDRDYCSDCPVRDACLQEALRTRVWGVWAGTSTKEREQMLRAQGRPLTPTQERVAQTHELVARLTAKGLTATQIVTTTGIEARTVLRHREKALHPDTKKATA